MNPAGIGEAIKQVLILYFTLESMVNRTEEEKQAAFKVAQAEFEGSDLAKIKDV